MLQKSLCPPCDEFVDSQPTAIVGFGNGDDSQLTPREVEVRRRSSSQIVDETLLAIQHPIKLFRKGFSTSSIMSSLPSYNIALIGLGSIGISFAALHLRFTNGTVKAFDPRPDLKEHLLSVLPGYLHANDPQSPPLDVANLITTGRLVICDSLEDACADADIIQEQGPENISFKQKTWTAIEAAAPSLTHFWSSTSGILASAQNQSMKDRTRLLVVHPFNPPHIMPLIEIVPSPETKAEETDFARTYFETLGSGHRPVVLKKEIPGFVGNRLAFALLREAVYLVENDVVSAKDLDTVMEASLGPRWAVQGPFKSYHMGGGAGGIRHFLGNLSSTIQAVWNGLGSVNFGGQGKVEEEGAWVDKIVKQTEEAYGMPDPAMLDDRDREIRRVLGL
ncbi:unnamed protein product [Clonostachys rosea f. rosea IK726]|uniref:3-hydroxyacyl-CoA dehydrogenase NAD binding domain-containing protein n=2 Tax=Bionectria ochroleuca TaxID=29856 RepID=A0A0B7JUK2_BIOOC|nr:unnamed protein product [Clonostachys rosea f. rosea IK726]